MRNRLTGAAAVEMALLLVLLLLIVSGIIEFGRTFWYYDTLAKATRDGARFLSEAKVSDTEAIDQALIDEARGMVVDAAAAAHVPGFVPGVLPASVTATCSPNCTAPDYVTVSVDYALTIGSWIPVISPGGTVTWDVTLSPDTTMRYMR